MIYLASDILGTVMRRTLEERGVHPVSIAHVVASLIQSSLRGVDSHGVNLFPHYCQAVVGGRINREPRIRIEQTAAGTSILDADHAFGHHAGAVAMDHAVAAAHDAGIAAVAVRNSTHFGAAAYFSLRAAEQDCIGLAFCNADALVKVHNSTERFFGTNPLCFAAPMDGEEPFCLDMATSLAAWNRVANARRIGKAIPANWAFDEEGRSVTDARLAHSLAPVGGYKGFDLGMMVDIVCALLAGGPISGDIPAMYGASLATRRHISHFFIALDITKFVPAALFKSRLKDMAERIRALPRSVDADDAVMVAGDPQKITALVRQREGIAMDEEKFSEFLLLSGDFAQAVVGK